MTASTWRIVPMRGGSRTINHPVIAVAPGCPTERHPTRWCACKVHTSQAAAEQYVAEQERQEVCS